MKICLECEGISDTSRSVCPSCAAPLTDTAAVHFPLRRGEADAGHPMLGTVVDGKYLVQGVLGKGGMGTVFRAIHQVSLIPVALKILNPRFSARREYREYFLAEAQKAGRVTHEHVGRILDVGEAEDGTVYIAMEEVNGLTLHECIYGGAPLDPAVVVEILEQVCEGLSAAHHAGLVHRDLSPRNVMVIVRQGRPFVKILDFGIAKGLPLAGAEALADVGHAPAGFASPPYSAPEHLEGADVDGRADLYSLGTIAYEALARRLPVRGQTPQERAEATLNGDLAPLPAVPGCPSRLVRLVGALLSRDPRGRPASVDVVLQALHAIRQPQARLVRDVAVLVCVLAVVVVALAYSRAVEPVLAKQVGALELAPGVEGLRRVQHCGSADLKRLRFEFEGFAAGDLTVLVTRVATNETLFDVPLGAVEVDGVLELDAGRSPAYADVVRRLGEASIDGPVQLTFKLRDGTTLGAARVRIDDLPPRLSIGRAEPGAGALRAGDRLLLGCQDDGDVRRVRLQVLDGQVPLFTEIVEAENLSTPLDVGRLFRGLQKSPAPMRKLLFRVSAHDEAGNRGGAEEFFDVDVVVPGIEPNQTWTATLIGAETAQLRFRITAAESGLRLFLRQSGGVWREARQATIAGTSVSVTLPGSPHDSVQEYEFRVQDEAGNVVETAPVVRFLAQDTRFRLDTHDPVLRHAFRPHDQGFVWTGARLDRVRLTCNPLYRPVGVAIRGRALGARLRAASPGSGVLQLDAAAGVDDVVELVVTLEDTARGSARVPQVIPLRIQSSPLQLRLPDATGARFLREVAEELFVQEAVGVYRQSARWVLKPADHRLLAGCSYWIREGDAPVRTELADRGKAADPFFTGQSARRGQNAIYLDLFDVFGRPVEVYLGARSKPAARQALGVRIAQFAAFPTIARLQPDPIRIEYRQPSLVTLSSDFAFAAADRARISLGLREQRIECRSLERAGTGTRLVFALDFARIVAALDLAPDDPRLRAEGEPFHLTFQLRTPAGDQVLPNVALSTRRSSLGRERLGDRFSGLPPAVQALSFVPVLRPLRPFADRVPADLRRTGGFLRGRAIAVKGLQDVFLQSRELSVTEYRAILTAFLAHAADDRPDAAAIVFPGDPAGARRLTATGMIPVLYGDDAARFLRVATDDAAAPVVGLSFYQAYAIARMAGFVVGRDPELFRLPFGVEMELAALGERPVGTLNGVAGRRLFDVRHGDVVKTPRGAIRGLDFGVREWVLDLPWPVGNETQQGLVEGYMSDHAQHLRYATGFDKLVTVSSLRNRLRGVGVVRGGALATSTGLEDLATGIRADQTGAVTAGVPGVVRESFVRRSGEGLDAGRPDRQLRFVGMRLAGSQAFVRRVRAR